MLPVVWRLRVRRAGILNVAGCVQACQTGLPLAGRRVASASSLPSLAYLLAPTPGSPESALMGGVCHHARAAHKPRSMPCPFADAIVPLRVRISGA